MTLEMVLFLLFMFIVTGLVLIFFLRLSERCVDAKEKPRHFPTWPAAQPMHRLDKSAQAAAVSQGSLEKKKLLEVREYQVFVKIENLLYTKRPYRVFPQVSMGEIFKSSDSKAYTSINCKRVDFCIVDGRGFPVIAVEYQGKGHFANDAILRDAIKREACRCADIHFLEWFPNKDDENLSRIAMLLDDHSAAFHLQRSFRKMEIDYN